MRRGEFAQDFPIEEHYTNLNHGSFGVCPLPVSRHVRSISDSHQISFGKFRSERLDNLLIASRKALSGILGTNYENLVYVRNASEALQTAVNAVKIMGEQGSLYLKRIVTTNHEYSSTNELLSDLAATLEIPLIIVNISHRSREAVTTALLEQAGDCSLVLVSHITSPWAERLDIDSLAGQLPLSSVLIVDAAHSPGCSPIGREVYERAFVAMSLHKWGFFPLGTGALSTPSDYHNFTKPVVCSLYHNQSYAKRFSWVGTDNYLNYLVGETVADWFNMLTEKNWDFGQFLINAATTELERFPEFTRIANNVGMLCMASWTVSNSLHSWHALRDAFEQENIYVWLGETKDEVIFRLSFAPYVTRNDLQKAVAVCERWRNGEFS